MQQIGMKLKHRTKTRLSELSELTLTFSQVSYVQISNFVGIIWGLGKLYIFENYMA